MDSSINDYFDIKTAMQCINSVRWGKILKFHPLVIIITIFRLLWQTMLNTIAHKICINTTKSFHRIAMNLRSNLFVSNWKSLLQRSAMNMAEVNTARLLKNPSTRKKNPKASHLTWDSVRSCCWRRLSSSFCKRKASITASSWPGKGTLAGCPPPPPPLAA